MGRLIAIGVGCKAGAPGEAIVATIRRALALYEPPPGDLRLFTLEAKREEPGLVEAALTLGASLIALPLERLAAEASRILTRSAQVEARIGVPAVAEAAALAGAGPGAQLLGPRLAEGGVTCAIAVSPEAA